MKKKLLAITLSCVIAMGAFPLAAYAGEDITILVDGRELETDVEPVQLNNRTLVPFRAIANSLGAQVSWDGNKKSVVCKKDGTALTLTVDSDVMIKNGIAVKLDTTPIISEGRVLVPVRALSEGFGAKVNWYAKERLISIRTDLQQDNTAYEEHILENAQVEMRQTTKEYTDSRGKTVFKYSCDVPYVTDSGSVADKINAFIASNVEYYLEGQAESLKDEAVLASDIANGQHGSIGAYSLVGSAQVTKNGGGILSIVITCTTEGCQLNCEGYKTNKFILPMVFSTKTGNMAAIGDAVDSKSLTKAKSAIIAKIKKDERGFRDDYVKLIQEKDPKFYVTDAGITFLYEPGYVNKSADDEVSYIMKFSEMEFDFDF